MDHSGEVERGNARVCEESCMVTIDVSTCILKYHSKTESKGPAGHPGTWPTWVPVTIYTHRIQKTTQ